MRTRRLLLVGGLVALSGLLSACSDAKGAAKTLAGAGYTAVQTDGHGWLFHCSSGDGFQTLFSAIGPTGVAVSGVVCSGIFKGSTVRLD